MKYLVCLTLALVSPYFVPTEESPTATTDAPTLSLAASPMAPTAQISGCYSPFYCGANLPTLDYPDCPLDPACKAAVEAAFAFDVAQVNQQACLAYEAGCLEWENRNQVIQTTFEDCIASFEPLFCALWAEAQYAENDRLWAATQEAIHTTWWNNIEDLKTQAQRTLATTCCL